MMRELNCELIINATESISFVELFGTNDSNRQRSIFFLSEHVY